MAKFSLSQVRLANAQLVNTKPFVAVIGGGTAGIGEHTTRQLAETFRQNGNDLRVYILGRKQPAADKIIADCRQICPGGQFIFIKGDLCLIKECDRVCAEIIAREQKISEASGEKAKVDLLVASQGFVTLKQSDTEEGLDRFLCIGYFSRARLAINLLPLLRESPLQGRVVFIGNCNLQDKMDLDDLETRQNGNMRLRAAHLTGLMSWFLEELARQNPGKIAGCHYFPGFVKTGLAANSELPWILKLIWRWLIYPIAGLWAVPLEECGQRVIFMATPRFASYAIGGGDDRAENGKSVDVAVGRDGVVGSGAYDVDWDGGTVAVKKAVEELRKKDAGERIWEHTMAAFEAIQSGIVWRGYFSERES